MSEFMFGVSHVPCSEEEACLRDKICKEEGGYGYTYITDPTGKWTGWFAGPNQGNPFDNNLRDRVLSRLSEIEK